MPWPGFEPGRLAALPPQDSVSTSFTTRAGERKLETAALGVKRPAMLAVGPGPLHTPAMLRVLDADKILETLERLGRRVRERFPDAGLNNVAAELLAIGRDTERCGLRGTW